MRDYDLEKLAVIPLALFYTGNLVPKHHRVDQAFKVAGAAVISELSLGRTMEQ